MNILTPLQFGADAVRQLVELHLHQRAHGGAGVLEYYVVWMQELRKVYEALEAMKILCMTAQPSFEGSLRVQSALALQ